MSDETATSQPPIKITWLFGIAIAFVLFAAIGGYSARMTADYSDYDQDRAAQRYDTLKKLQADESKQLNPVNASGQPSAIWIDQGKGIISIPIEQAMAKEVDDLRAKAPAAGNEINPAPAAPAAPAPAAGSTNAAPVAPAAPANKPAAPAAKAPATNAPAATRPPAKPAKTTSITPGVIGQPVFHLREVKIQAGTELSHNGFINYGVSLTAENNAVSPVPAAQTN